MQIIDNFLEPEIFDTIAHVAKNEMTEWRLLRSVSGESVKDGMFLVRGVYAQNAITCNSYQYLYENFVTKLADFNHLIRLRFIMYLQTSKIVEHEKHTDYEFPHKGALLYLNTNNGFTRLEDGTKVESVANRLLLHDSTKMHNSTTCTDESTRALLVCNYI